MGETQPQQQPAQQPPVQAQGQPGAPGAPPAAPVDSKGWYTAKIVLGSAALVFSIISVGLSAGNWLYFGYDILWTVPIAGLSICWLVAEFITLCVRRHRKGIHPGAHVGMHLIIWLGFLSCVILNAANVYVSSARNYSSYYYGSTYYNSAARQKYRSMVQAELAFSVLLLIIHFTLFVRACIETNTRNRTRSNVQYVYVQQPMYYAPQPGMPQQQQPPMGYAPQQQQMAPGMQPAHYSGQWNGYYGQQQQQPMHGAATHGVQNHTTGQSDPSSLSVSQSGNAHGVEAPGATYGGQGQHAA